MARPIRVGLVGAGFMGRAHALALRSVAGVFSLTLAPVLEMLADVDEASAARNAAALGFARSTADWRALVADPAVDVVDITAPNALHKPIALAALAAGKPVWCEKPLAATAEDAQEMAQAATQAGVATQVGFNYTRNPLLGLARRMIEAGELGDITGFRGIHAEDYNADPRAPWTWRLDPAGGAGVIADLGSHIVNMARFLLGPIESVCADVQTVHRTRPFGDGSRAVEVDDQARILARFARGCGGTIEANWLATGRKMQLEWEVFGTRGSLAFTQERFNELRWYEAGAPPGREGFRTLLAGPAHEPYGAFCPAPGHQLGFNDLKVIEARDFLLALSGTETPGRADFAEAAAVQRVVDAALRSSRDRGWIRLA
jgi:predicted dehydrogenase